MHIAMIARSGWHAVGQRIGTLFIWVNKAYSRGAVTLEGRMRATEPGVDFRLLSDERDFERLKLGFRTGASFLRIRRWRSGAGPAFPTSYSARVAAIGGPGLINTLQRGVFAGMLDYAGPLRAALIRNVVTLGTTLDESARGRRRAGRLHRRVGRRRVARIGNVPDGSGGRSAGGDRRGGAGDGVAGLRVCDASLMPSIPRANTNTPTLMMAERIADLVKAERR